MKRIVIALIAVSSLSACQEQNADQVKTVATPYINDAIEIATPIVNKGMELVNKSYPTVKQKMQEGADAIGRIDLNEVQNSLQAPVAAKQVQQQRAAGPDRNGNLDYGLNKNAGPDSNGNLDYGLGR